MEVSYIDHMGTDLSVVNAARVSFAKKHEEFDEDKDSRLIRYLAKHGHWTPFGHTSVTLHFKAPIFIARQLQKHQVGLVWNEVSRRYVDDEPDFFVPKAWRKRPEGSVKQGSSEEEISVLEPRFEAWGKELSFFNLIALSKRCYESLLDDGVAPEQARMVLPQSMYTEWYWTGSIAAWARIYQLRIDPSAQKEVQGLATELSDVIAPLFPVSWEALNTT